MSQLTNNLKEQIAPEGKDAGTEYFPPDFPADFFSQSNWKILTLEPEAHDKIPGLIKTWKAVLRPVLDAFAEITILGVTFTKKIFLLIEGATLTVRFAGNLVTDLDIASPIAFKTTRKTEPLKIAAANLVYVTSEAILEMLDFGFRIVDGGLRVREMRGEEENKTFNNTPKPLRFDWRMGGPIVRIDFNKHEIVLERNFYWDKLNEETFKDKGLFNDISVNKWMDTKIWIYIENYKNEVVFWQVRYITKVEGIEGAIKAYEEAWKSGIKNFNEDKSGAYLGIHKVDDDINNLLNYYAYSDSIGTYLPLMKSNNKDGLTWTHELGHHWGLGDIIEKEGWPFGFPYEEYKEIEESGKNSIMSYEIDKREILPFDIKYSIIHKLRAAWEIYEQTKESQLVLKNRTWIIE